MADPRFPALPVAIEEDPNSVVVYNDGPVRVRASYDLTYTQEDTERIRLGYCCIHCGESQVDRGECPFPMNCWVCGYPMRDKQAERFGIEFRGNKRIGPETTIEQELAIAEEALERERTASRIWVPISKDI